MPVALHEKLSLFEQIPYCHSEATADMSSRKQVCMAVSARSHIGLCTPDAHVLHYPHKIN